QIWVSENLVTGLKEATIDDMRFYTSSDHHFVSVTIKMDHLIKNYNKAIMKRKQSTRWVFLYEKATKEDWKNYAKDLNLFLERKLGSNKGVEN
ncbi:23385_t:CDS:1, partial [Gigaspora rosea]